MFFILKVHLEYGRHNKKRYQQNSGSGQNQARIHFESWQ